MIETLAAVLTSATIGMASWYGAESHGKIMANGEPFDMHAMTCASWDYPFRTRLKVTNLANGKSVRVIVTDRGPAKRLGRVVDLSRRAFDHIADPKLGLIKVKVEIYAKDETTIPTRKPVSTRLPTH